MKKKDVCTVCSNGCLLSFSEIGNGEISLSGNLCVGGLGFTKKLFSNHSIINKQNISPFSFAEVKQVLLLWDKNLSTIKDAKMIAGSPERSLFRTVVETDDGKEFILEQIDNSEIENRARISKIVEGANLFSLPVVSYCLGSNDSYIQHTSDKLSSTKLSSNSHSSEKHWMLTPLISHRRLKRETYWLDEWRGKAVADFLVGLKSFASQSAPTGSTFALDVFIKEIVAKIEIDKPKLFTELMPVLSFLEREFFPIYRDIPLAFNHGDPHPLNMLWGDGDIKAVIDWEFSGLKPALYDASLIIGCVGSEDPDSISSGFIQTLLKEIKAQKLFTPDISKHLAPFIVAQRFAWMSEWLRHGDTEMVEFEVGYMEFLINNQKLLSIF
jgi:homoserine kinase type II